MSKRPVVLFLGANPSSTTRLALGKEIREIEAHLRLVDPRKTLQLEQGWAVRTKDLQGHLLRYRPTIVHFSGHGSDAGELFLERESGQVGAVSASALAELFRIFRKDTRCVVLNACFSEVQAQAIVTHVDCAIGMTSAIQDVAAIEFASTLYMALGRGNDMQTAFTLACRAIARPRDKPRHSMDAGFAPGTREFLAECQDELDPLAGDIPRLLVRKGINPAHLRLVDSAQA